MTDLYTKDTDKLVQYINNSFRVRRNQKPVYVDISGNLRRVESPQHQVIFGRRGSGKSCLLVQLYHESKYLCIYVDADQVKRLDYPDLLIRLLLEVFENSPSYANPFLRYFGVGKKAKEIVKELNPDFSPNWTNQILAGA